MTTTLQDRRDVALETTWDLAAVYPTIDAWEEAFRSLEQEIPRIKSFDGLLSRSAHSLHAWLILSNDLESSLEKLVMWASCSSDEDIADQVSGARLGRAIGLSSKVHAAMSFARPEILGLGAEKVAAYVKEHSPLLQFERYFEVLFREAAHVRSPEVEELLAQAANPLSATRTASGVLTNAEITFTPAKDSNSKEYEVAQGSVEELLHSSDRELRKSAWISYADGFIALKGTLAALLSGKINASVFRARARGYNDTLHASLSGNQIPVSVYENIISACSSNFPIWHRYWALRKRALKVETLHSWDTFAPLGEPVSIPYAQSVEYICQGLAPLGAEYVDTVRRACTVDRWVDYARNRGKRSGAYSSGSYGTPAFILMSYSEHAGVPGMSTLAHELGHSMHTHLTNASQPFMYSGYSLCAAEVASNFNQAMIRADLLEKNTDKRFRLALLEEAMQNFHRYFFIMPILSQIERQLHQALEAGQSPGADEISANTAAIFRRGYGPAMEVDSAREGITWAQFAHLYYDFYVWQYASGIGAANVLATAVRAGGEGERTRYLEFLKAGSTLDPLDALRRAGIDLSVPGALDPAFKVMSSYIDELERLID